MDYFQYRNGALWAEDVPLSTIVEAVGTPFYCYSAATLTRHYEVFTEALAGLPALVCYSVKANSNLAVIRTLARLGAGVDVVSGGELTRALRAGDVLATITIPDGFVRALRGMLVSPELRLEFGIARD